MSRAKPRHVCVVMGNGFPDSVWESTEQAEEYCEAMNAAEKELVKRVVKTKVYYSRYEMEIRRG